MKAKVYIVIFLFFTTINCCAFAECIPNFGTQLTFADYRIMHHGNWSPDGKWIAIDIWETSTYRNFSIWLYPVDGGEPVKLIDANAQGGNEPKFPCFTKDSKEVYFTNHLWTSNNESKTYIGSNIEKINIESGEKTVVLENASHGVLSHNNRYIVYNSQKIITVHDFDTGETWDIAEDPTGSGVKSSFSPDDSHILVMLGEKGARYIHKIPLKGGESEQLTFEKGEDWFPVYTYDGKWILYTHFLDTYFGAQWSMETRVYNTETGETRNLLPEVPRATQRVHCTFLSPDGKKVCYSRYLYTENNQLFITDFQPERIWNPHFEVIPYDTKSQAVMIIPVENAPTINGKSIEVGDEIAVFTPRNVCAGIGVWAGETLVFDVWGDEYFVEGTLGFKRDEPYEFRIWDISEQKELSADAAFLDETVCGSKTRDVYCTKSFCKLASLTAVSEPTVVESGEVPETFVLSQNYPNPFNPTTTINYRLNQPGMVNLVIYNLLGRKVATLVDEIKTPGSHEVTWYAEGLANGVYFCRIQAGDSKVLTQKMILVK
ncbi:MAG: T9SS type A sorting domain-containing protein [Candidatus Latescibacteria bacterium]|nr:T9SS type A sorting domain-containing protein [Candidatus Latescibacterota bacterium]